MASLAHDRTEVVLGARSVFPHHESRQANRRRMCRPDEPRKYGGASPAGSIVAPCCRSEVSLSRAYQEGDARMTSAATLPTSPSMTTVTPTTTPCTSTQG